MPMFFFLPLLLAFPLLNYSQLHTNNQTNIICLWKNLHSQTLSQSYLQATQSSDSNDTTTYHHNGDLNTIRQINTNLSPTNYH
jgi:hypothetical protein